MSDVGPEERSYERIERADLERLAAIAEADRAGFFARHPEWGAQYRDRVLAVALCQGAALHYLLGRAGVQDFDLYTFYARHPARPWYANRKAHADFGLPKFGTSPDKPRFRGRRVDLLGRSLDAPVGSEPAAAIRAWLRAGRAGESAAYLREKAVVLVAPAERNGEIVWPAGALSNRNAG